jgi:hypothetical protein
MHSSFLLVYVLFLSAPSRVNIYIYIYTYIYIYPAIYQESKQKMKATSSAGSLETKLDRVRKQLSLGNLRRRISSKTRSNSESQMYERDDVDHLLENSEPLDAMLSFQKASAADSPINGVPNENDNTISKDEDENNHIDKYKIPSSLIVLTAEEKKKLESVLVQIGLREVGLG